MNKKLLGIAAVALLGVSAAFAATTSTVYFTASGTLTKYDAPSFGLESIVVGDAVTSLPLYVYKGEETSTSNISCTPLDDGKVENTKVVAGHTSDYLYTKYKISGLKFQNKGDYCFFTLNYLNNEDKAFSFTYDVVRKVKLTNNKNSNASLSIGGYSNASSIVGNNADKFSVKIGNAGPLMLDDNFGSYSYYFKSDVSTIYTYTVEETLASNSESYSVGAKSTGGLLMLIQLNEDITTDSELSLNVTLPTFKKAE